MFRRLAHYWFGHIQFIAIVSPLLLLVFYLEGWIREEQNLSIFSLIVLAMWVLLMKEVALWAYIQEMTLMQKIIKSLTIRGFFTYLNKKNRIVLSIFILRALLKIFSWIFVFVLGHTWLFMFDVELSDLLLLSSSIIFYMATELLIVIRVAHIEFLAKEQLYKKEHKQT